jgi:hypothetical protein
MFNKIELGSLVYDADPYKAPEILYGIGLVIRIIDNKYVEVQWTQWSFTSIERIDNLEVVDESG